jgi:hypothetical protein
MGGVMALFSGGAGFCSGAAADRAGGLRFDCFGAPGFFVCGSAGVGVLVGATGIQRKRRVQREDCRADHQLSTRTRQGIS